MSLVVVLVVVVLMVVVVAVVHALRVGWQHSNGYNGLHPAHCFILQHCRHGAARLEHIRHGPSGQATLQCALG